MASQAPARFRRYLAATGVSMTGDELTRVGFPILAYGATHSAAVVGAVAATMPLAAVLLGPIAGAAGDLWPRRLTMVTCNVGRAVLLIGLAWWAWDVRPSTAVLIVVAGLAAVLTVVHDGAAAAGVQLLLGEDPSAYGWANGRLVMAQNASITVGPLAAGVLISAFGPPAALAVDGATFLASGAVVGGLDELDRGGGRATLDSGIGRATVDGILLLWRDKDWLTVLSVLAVMNGAAAAADAQFVPYARKLLHMSSLEIGVMFTVGGLAAIATGAVISRMSHARGGAVAAGTAMLGAGVLLAGLFPSLPAVLVEFVAAGIGSTIVGVHVATMRNRRFAVDVAGRVRSGGQTIVFSMLFVAQLGGGLLAQRFGSAALFTILGTIAVFYSVLMYPRIRHTLH